MWTLGSKWLAVAALVALAGWPGPATPPTYAPPSAAWADEWQDIAPVPDFDGDLLIAPSDPAVLYAHQNAGNRVFRSRDRGASWEALPLDPKAGDLLAIDPSNAERLLVGGRGSWGGQLLASEDGGRTLAPLNAEAISFTFQGGIVKPELPHLAIHPAHPELMLLDAQTSRGPRSRAYGIWRSQDGGATWVSWRGNASVATFDPQHDGTVYAYDDISTPSFFPARRLSRTTDDGATWQVIDPDATQTVQALALDRFDAATLYVAKAPFESGTRQVSLFRSRDGGASWQLLTSVPAPATAKSTGAAYLATDPAQPGGIAVGLSSGGFRWSGDYGETWLDLSDNLPDALSHQLTYDAPGEYLYSAHNTGLYRLQVRRGELATLGPQP